jgi:hypothetical protein
MSAVWATKSKTPGRKTGYRTICESPQHGHLANYLTGLGETGTPQGHNEGAFDELPWLTFAGGAAIADPLMAVASMNWSDEVDGTRQPIMPVRAIWLQWGGSISYRSLWQSTLGVRWPEVDRGPITSKGHLVDVTVPPTDWKDVTRDVEEFGFERMASLAASIVDGTPVAIVLERHDVVALADRVRFLDAVMALMPFGARNCVPMSTWASSGTNHGCLLAFSDGVNKQVPAPWRGDFHPRLRTQRAVDYLAELRRAHRQIGGAVQLVEHLVTLMQPLRSVEEISTEQLGAVLLPLAVHEEVVTGRGSVERVLEVLDTRASRLADDERRDHFRFLGENMDQVAEARAGLLRHWCVDTAVVLGRLFRENAHQGQSQGWFQLAEAGERTAPGSSAAYVAEALRHPLVRNDDPALTSLADLVINHLSQRPVEQVLAALREQPHVLLAVLDELVVCARTQAVGKRKLRRRTEAEKCLGHLRSGLERLETKGPDWLRAVLRADEGKLRKVAAEDVRELVKHGWQAVATLVRMIVSSSGNDSDKAADACWSVIHPNYVVNRPDLGEAAELARSFFDAHAGPSARLSQQSRARTDYLALLTHQEPGHLLDGPPMHEEYLRAVRADRLEQVFLDHFETMLLAGRIREVDELRLPDEWMHVLARRPNLVWLRDLRELGSAVKAGGVPAGEIATRVAGIVARADLADAIAHTLRTFARERSALEFEGLLLGLCECGEVPGHIAVTVLNAVQDGQCGEESRDGLAALAHERYRWAIWLGGGRVASH